MLLTTNANKAVEDLSMRPDVKGGLIHLKIEIHSNGTKLQNSS